MQFKVVCMEYSSNGDIQYKFKSNDGLIRVVPLKDIVEFVSDSDNETDLIVDEDGVCVKPADSSLYIPVMEVQTPMPELNDVDILSGKTLKTAFNSEKHKWFVRSELTIMDYLNNKSVSQICAVCGIRFTGKRELVKSELLLSGLLEDAVWFTVNESIRHIRLKMLMDVYGFTKNTKVIVIENSERIRDFHKASWVVNLIESGVKVIIITPGDLFLKKSHDSVFFGCVHSVYTTGVTYLDFKVMNKKADFVDYCKALTIKRAEYENPLIKRQAIDKTIPNKYNILDDLLSAIAPNQFALDYFAKAARCTNKQKEIKAELYKLVRCVIFKSEDDFDSSDTVVGPSSTGILDNNTIKILNNHIDKQLADGLGLEAKTVGNKILNGIVISSLIEMGIIVYASNSAEFLKGALVDAPNDIDKLPVGKRIERSLYFSSPFIVNRLSDLELRILNDCYLPCRLHQNTNDRFGFVFESAVVYNTLRIVKGKDPSDNSVYMYRDIVSREYDMIITQNKLSSKDRKITFCEIKCCNSLDVLLSQKSLKWICAELADKVAEVKLKTQSDNVQRALIYCGESLENEVALSPETKIKARVINVEDFIQELNKTQDRHKNRI